MDQTDVWMIGVGAFGIVFYILAIFYQNNADDQG